MTLPAVIHGSERSGMSVKAVSAKYSRVTSPQRLAELSGATQ